MVAHFEFTRISIGLTILPKKIEESESLSVSDSSSAGRSTLLFIDLSSTVSESWVPSQKNPTCPACGVNTLRD